MRLEVEGYGEGVYHLHALIPRSVGLEEPGVRIKALGVGDQVIGEGHVVGGGQHPVVPEDIVPEVEGQPGHVVGELPGFRQVRSSLEILVELHEGHEVHELLVLGRKNASRSPGAHSPEVLHRSCHCHPPVPLPSGLQVFEGGQK